MQSNPILYPLIGSWSIAEIIRYSYYFSKSINYTPFLLKWLRYNAFLILYPIGMLSELFLILSIFRSQIYIPSTKVEENLREKDNTIRVHPLHNVALVSFLLIAIFGYPLIYKHMMKQRNRHLK